jgi:prevent-host-death family protein
MLTTSISSDQLQVNAKMAMDASRAGPVIITDRGKPTHVLLMFADYKKLISAKSKISELLAMPDADNITIELRRSDEPARAADLE